MYQAMKVHENSWHMPQQKGFGCLWEKKSKLCSVRLKVLHMSLGHRIAVFLHWRRAGCGADRCQDPNSLSSLWYKTINILKAVIAFYFMEAIFISVILLSLSLFLFSISSLCFVLFKYWSDSDMQFTVAFFFFLSQGWRCKRYGHRTGDKECPFFIKGNQKLEQFRVVSTNTVVLLLVFLT